MENWSGPLILLVLLVVIWLVNSRSRRGRRRQVQLENDLQNSLRPGYRVMTTSGLVGVVVSLGDPPFVVLEVAPGVHTTWDRRAIAEVVDDVTDPVAGAVVGEEVVADEVPGVVDVAGGPGEAPGRKVDVRSPEPAAEPSGPPEPITG